MDGHLPAKGLRMRLVGRRSSYRWGRWRRRHLMKRSMQALVLFALGVGVGAMLPATRGEIRADIAHGAVWISRQTDSLGDWFRMFGDRITDTEILADTRPEAPGSATLSGSARVIDGDTLDLHGTRIRLHGIDAPEQKQSCRAGGQRWACGREATRALKGRLANRPVACEPRDRDRYGRVIAVCRVRDEDLNAWMVAEGWALAYRAYSHAYVTEETIARTEKRGVWRGELVEPWKWRRGERLP